MEKVSAEVRAPPTGASIEALVAQGDVVRQGAPIAVLEAGGRPRRRSRPRSPGRAPARRAVPGAPGPSPASPAARRLARELGVDLATGVRDGTRGPDRRGGRARGARRATAAARAPSGGAPVADAPDDRRPPAAGLATAQLTLTAEADVTELAARARSPAGASRAAGPRTPRRSCAPAPSRSATTRGWRGAGPRRASAPVEPIDIGVAVALDDGLIVPVVRDADRKDLAALGEEIRALAERARAGTITSPETQGAVFSVTNLGAHRIDAFTPLLDPPQTAILGVGRARPRPAVVDGQVVARTLVVLSLTFDHRVVDGEPAAAFLDQVIALLEEPSRLA